MNDSNVMKLLRGMRFFDGVADQELIRLAALAQLEEYAAGVAIFKQGKQGSKFFLVVDGSVSLEIATADGATKRIHTVGPGELLGWSPLLKSGAMKATARPLTEAKLISFDAAQTLALCERAPSLGISLLRQVACALAERLHATRLHLLEVCHHQLPDGLPLGSREGAD